MIGSKPLVSVAIAAYNHERFVQETIRSIIAQTYPNIELIVIDDGSPDATWLKILELKSECEKRFARVCMQTQENIGCALTSNKLVSLAKGDYVYSIASDDLAKPYAIEKQVAFLASHNDYGLVVGNNEFIDGEGNRCYWDENCNNVYNEEYAKYKTAVDVLGKMNPYFNNEKFGSYETLYMNNYIPNGYLVRRELYNIILPFSKEAPLEDWFFMLQLSKYCKFKYIDQVLFSYRWHDNNTIKKSVKIQDYREATREYEEKVLEMLQDELPPKFKQILDIGVLSKKWGVPYIFEIFTYNKIKEKRLVKTKILKIFNVKIGKYVKSKLLQ